MGAESTQIDMMPPNRRCLINWYEISHVHAGNLNKVKDVQQVWQFSWGIKFILKHKPYDVNQNFDLIPFFFNLWIDPMSNIDDKVSVFIDKVFQTAIACFQFIEKKTWNIDKKIGDKYSLDVIQRIITSFLMARSNAYVHCWMIRNM